MSRAPTTDLPPGWLRSPGWLLLVLVLAGWSAFPLSPVAGRKLGVTNGGPWFIDSYAVLAASDAVRAGLDPFEPNPLDVYLRPHSYSRWWFYLGDLGLTRQDNFFVGGSWVVLFLVAGVILLRPHDLRMIGIGGAVLLSPPVLLAVNRANNDLVVFILLAVGLWVLREAKFWRMALFALTVSLATGLKFYPFIAGICLLLVRPPRLGLTATVLCLLTSVTTFASVWTDFKRAAFPVPENVFTFGAQIIFRDFGLTGPMAVLLGTGLLSLGAGVCHWRGWSIRLDAGAEDLRASCSYACGAVLLVGCFLAGISYSYRLIYVIFLVPWMWRHISTRAGRVTGLLLAAMLWSDGFYCLGTNLLIGPMPKAQLVHLQLIWRFFTQPIIWAAMALLAGSLLGLLRSALESLRPPVCP